MKSCYLRSWISRIMHTESGEHGRHKHDRPALSTTATATAAARHRPGSAWCALRRGPLILGRHFSVRRSHVLYRLHICRAAVLHPAEYPQRPRARGLADAGRPGVFGCHVGRLHPSYAMPFCHNMSLLITQKEAVLGHGSHIWTIPLENFTPITKVPPIA